MTRNRAPSVPAVHDNLPPWLNALTTLRRTPPPTMAVRAIQTEAHGPPDQVAAGRFLYGDNLLAMRHLVDTHAGRIMCIYADPPFDQGGERRMRVPLAGEAALRAVAYRDAWGADEASYLQMMRDRLVLMRELLHPQGTLYLHCDGQSNALLRLLCDEIFGRERFMNQIIWAYKTGGVSAKRGFARKHDDILVYTRGDDPIFHPILQKSFVPTLPEPHTPSGKRLGVMREDGCSRCDAPGPGQKYRMVRMRDVWDDIPTLFRNDTEAEGYPTQKPVALLERIVATSSNPGDCVADFFCGSGGLAEAAHRLGRAWVCADEGRLALHAARRRWLQAGMPFTVERITPEESPSPETSAPRRIACAVTVAVEKRLFDWQVRIERFEPAYEGLTDAECAILTAQASPALLDVWSLDPEWQESGVFRHACFALRERRGARGVARELALPRDTASHTFGLFTADVLGFVRTHVVPLAEGTHRC